MKAPPTNGEATGWKAIDRVLRDVYGSQVPKHVGYVPGLHLGSGLQGTSAFDAGNHWHYVSYGLTELWEKNPDADPQVSGWGYELTLRVVKNGDEPPSWPFTMLERIARHTHAENHRFLVGDRVEIGAPITGSDDTWLTAFALTFDPRLPTTTSLNGSFEFRQLFGITDDELTEMRSKTTDTVLERIRRNNMLLVTDPAR
jgi:hypothetical protein